MARRRNPYQVHVYLPEWMRAAIREAAERRRWTVNTYLGFAVEELLRLDGFERPSEEGDRRSRS